ncbi:MULTISPECIES: DUF2335 domain-containing protein [Enterobacter cloacae complex]|uniref:DUF2335 domain-containing protein n=1 Tax=Enterobacter cloacae complex TaxID=354276 RepID=UPI001BD60E91|nr:MULTISPECIES: DUF2335 domain-containing protein [Enterobacter cloacae complex]EHN8900129.1 DUF2335 domain-containing protein [Enterobacter hormaechei]HDC4588599.1 DUF2335 domain-containing protein [Enterobacter kobei]MBT2029204.1 DUF2335 domain-containing protein [Enterobacter roggenkampii]MBT2033742.1 DUF2335 domain-containing protein [Enterobacter roggenkampii]MCM7018728.1 DUF2335 domain-containing protein [Enterobacter asburiae]
MSRKKPQRKPQNADPRNLVNQPATLGRVQDGKTELLVNEVVKNPQVLERLMDRPEMAGIMMQVTHTRSGPLPDADELARYERVSPGFAREIMEMAKAEQKHRHEHLKKGQNGAIWRDRLGQIFAMISVLIFAGLAYVMIQHEAFGWATGLLGVELVALTSVFVAGRKVKQSPNQIKK